MNKDQKTLLLFQLDNIIDLGDAINDEKRTELIGNVRTYVDELSTGKRKPQGGTEIEVPTLG